MRSLVVILKSVSSTATIQTTFSDDLNLNCFSAALRLPPGGEFGGFKNTKCIWINFSRFTSTFFLLSIPTSACLDHLKINVALKIVPFRFLTAPPCTYFINGFPSIGIKYKCTLRILRSFIWRPIARNQISCSFGYKSSESSLHVWSDDSNPLHQDVISD